MKTITLTDAQRDVVLTKLAEYRDECGDFDILIPVDNFTVEARGFVQVDGYRNPENNDYIETLRVASVRLTGYTEDCEEVWIDQDSEDACDTLLNAA